jgi:hypothetical protein
MTLDQHVPQPIRVGINCSLHGKNSGLTGGTVKARMLVGCLALERPVGEKRN